MAGEILQLVADKSWWMQKIMNMNFGGGGPANVSSYGLTNYSKS